MNLYNVSSSWADFNRIISNYIQRKDVVKVLEIGGGARPYLSSRAVSENKILYTVVDIEKSELDKSDSSFFITQIHDISENPLEEKYDLIFSKMVLEHIISPNDFHRNILEMCHISSVICHFFATKYGLPSLLNLLLPEFITDKIIYKLQGRDEITEGKFKAYYRRCNGPTKSSLAWFEKIGYDVIKYNGYIGHSYLGKYKLWRRFENSLSNLFLKINSAYLTSNAILVLKSSNNN